MPGTCNDCGAAFKGDVKGHVDDAHPGLPRFRFRDAKGVDHIVCADCGDDLDPTAVVEKTQYVPGKSTDPVFLADLHLMAHKKGA